MAKIKIGNGKGPKGDTGAQGQTGAQGAQGVRGEVGAQGQKGADGKTAYQYAREAGYSGTESEFSALLNMNGGHMADKNNPHGVTAAQVGAAAASHTHTAAQVGAAAASHTHTAADVASGTLPITRGGTGSTTAAGGRAALETAKPVWGEVFLTVDGWYILPQGVFAQQQEVAFAKGAIKGYPCIGLSAPSDIASMKIAREAYQLLFKVNLEDGRIMFYSEAKPEVNFTVLVSGGVN